jgi:hypothetical protein
VSSKKKADPRASIVRHGSDLPTGYASWLKDLKIRIRTTQVTAALAVNAELVLLYWSIGRDILVRQDKEGWGAHVIERLSADLHVAFPDMKGCHHRARRVPLSAASPVPRDPPVDETAVLRLFQPRREARVGESARGRRCGVGVLSVEGVKVGQGRAVRKPFSRTKCSARSVRRSAMTCALRASGKTLVQSLKARLVVMQVERR